MQIGVLGNEGSWYVRELQRAGGELGHEVFRLEFPRIVATCGLCTAAVRERPALAIAGPLPDGRGTDELNLNQLDAVIIRTMPPGSLEQVVYRMDALARLEASGVVVFNPPKSVECAVDKYLTTAKLEAEGLPVPATVVCENSDDALVEFERLGSDVVVKPIFGSEGRGILRVSDSDLALRTFRTLERLDAVLYLQRFVDHPGFDIRVLVLDGRVLGGMRRVSDGDFRTNVSREGRGEAHVVTDQEAEWALRAAAATGARFAGIDILYDRDGNGFVIEVNAVPGWRAFEKVTGMDVARAVIEAVL
jgi:ribosomal protein S6--L-glutamate ligase